MADNQTPPPILPQPPDHYQLPVQLLEQWTSLPAGQRFSLLLTKQDIDQLVFAFLRLAEAQSKLEGSLVSWSNGQLADANAALPNLDDLMLRLRTTLDNSLPASWWLL
jgi:hypothetical protein